jgi:cytochrome c-type biogenesis protein CcsB
MTSHVYLILTSILYAVGALHVLLQALTRRRLHPSRPLIATLAGFALHTAGLSQRWTESGRFPAIGLSDAASFLAWAIVLVFLMTYMRTRVDVLGLAVYPAAFALLLVANLTPTSRSADPTLHSVFLPVHATFAFFGYAALFVAFTAGVLYLVQERELKSRSPHRFYYLVPSLERCDTLSGRSVMWGFGFLTLAIVTGLLWNHAEHGRYWRWDAKELSALIAWAIYVGLIVTRYRTGWGGRRAAFLGIAGFAAVVFTFVWMNVIAPGPAP